MEPQEIAERRWSSMYAKAIILLEGRYVGMF
jgi:sporulation protein YlmC with PRC-barrel domain